MEISKMKI